MFFDLLIKGGELIDPASDRHGPFDVAIHRGRVAAVDRDIPVTAAARVIDATGQIVTPGLVYLHTHVYHHVTYWGIHADPVAARMGVTTWLDVGSERPDVISSDIHQSSILGPLFDLPTCLSKFLLLGMSLPDQRAIQARGHTPGVWRRKEAPGQTASNAP